MKVAGGLVVVGSVNADLYFHISRLPLPGETIDGSHADISPGGKGANQAVAAARLGMPTTFIGQWGDDVHRPMLEDALHASGVNTDPVGTVDGPSGQAAILLQASGENSIIVISGANGEWDELTDVQRQAIAAAELLLLQREVPEAINIAAASLATERGVPVVLDAGGELGPLANELLTQVDILSPNETELARMTGMPTDSHREVVAAAQQLQADGVAEVLVKLGARGSLWLGPEDQRIEQGIFSRSVVDTTGAGDCFTAAFAVARMRGEPVRACLRYAAAAATVCVSRQGAIPSMPQAGEVAELLAD